MQGLITTERKGADPAAAPFAKAPGEIEGLGLREGANLVELAMREVDSLTLAIVAMSNPTMNGSFFKPSKLSVFYCEMHYFSAVDAFNHAGENIVFASGSPFKNVDLGNGKVGHVNQANSMYLFPGIGMGALLSRARLISDGMAQAVSECLASYITDEEI
ncbi:hypothetical protein LOK49_LG02G01165 [Camellia lanceoleosa]|uniref:Uncharacterized protein n=1 Tax=Camellia lanceoleosa TaxID=1840588 RepID=A0ACC0IGP9_9ERIC|nr:hypothetical protein LOK49_LG02G01165 [Camellia lanceoleosa]